MMNLKINLLAENFGVEGLPWWAILVIAVGVLVLVMVIPWKKIHRLLTNKKTKTEVLQLETKEESKQIESQLVKNPQNTPYWGIYNWFGKKQALRTTKWIYVQEQEDPCSLCRPFENQVLSLEEYAQNATTMSEAISQGYHHLGCHHLDLDYFHGVTQVPTKNHWSKEHKQTRYHLRLKQYQLEQKLRDFKYKLENENLKPKLENELRNEIKITEEELINFIQENDLIRNLVREDPAISDWKKFS